MKKFFKLLLTLLLIIILLIVIAAAVLSYYIKPEQLRVALNTTLTQTTGYKTHIDKLEWHALPSPSLVATQLTVANPATFNGQLATIERIEFNLRLRSLLNRVIDFSHITLHGAHIQLQTNVNGVSNWQIKTAGISTPTQLASLNNDNITITTKKNSNFSDFFKIKAVQIERFSLSNSKIEYRNELKNFQTTFSQLELTNGQFSKLWLASYPPVEGLTFFVPNLKFDFHYNPLQKPTNQSITGQCHFSGHITSSNNTNQKFSPNSLLRKLQLAGKIALTQTKINAITIDQVNTDINANINDIELKTIQSQLYEGTAQGSLTIQLIPQPNFKLAQNFSHINLGKFLKDLIGKSRVNTAGDVALELTGAGTTQTELLEQLNGQVQFAFNRGRLEGINIPGLINSIVTKFHTKESDTNLKATATEENTEFDKLNGHAFIKQGIIDNDQLQIESNAFTTTGHGTIDLNTPMFDLSYNLNTTLLNLAPDSKVAKIQQQLGGSFPLQIFGNLQRPLPSPDLKAIMKVQAKSFIQDKANSLINNEQLNKTKDKVKKFLNQLLE